MGLTSGLGSSEQLARLCAEQGCRVLVPSLIGRDSTFAGNPGVRSTRHSQRGDPLAGRIRNGAYADHLRPAQDPKGCRLVQTRPTNATAPASPHPPSLALVGYGEGGLLVLYAAAADTASRRPGGWLLRSARTPVGGAAGRESRVAQGIWGRRDCRPGDPRPLFLERAGIRNGSSPTSMAVHRAV